MDESDPADIDAVIGDTGVSDASWQNEQGSGIVPLTTIRSWLRDFL